MPEPSHSGSRWNPWPISIIAFFTSAIIGCGTFIAFCSRHPADLVAADYYEQEVRYQGQIERLQHAQQPAASPAVTYDPATQVISISLPSRFAPAKPSGSIQLYRPSATNLDRQIKLTLNDQGMQKIDARSLRPGLWKVRVSWTADREEFYLDQKIVIAAKSS